MASYITNRKLTLLICYFVVDFLSCVLPWLILFVCESTTKKNVDLVVTFIMCLLVVNVFKTKSTGSTSLTGHDPGPVLGAQRFYCHLVQTAGKLG